MSDDVNIRISATDNATATLRAVQAQLNSFSSTVKNIAGFTLAGIGVQQVSSFLSGTLREYAEAEKSQTRLQSVLKATGNTTKLTFAEINDFTDRLEKTTGTSGESLNDAAANLSRFANITGDQFKDVLSLANDMSKVLGSDVTSNVQLLAKALNSPAEGLSRLSRLGVSFNEVQKAQIEMLDQVGMKAEAQAKILEEIRRQFGGAGEDFGKTTAGQLEVLNARIGDLKEAIGQRLTPTVTALISLLESNMGVVPGAAGRADALLSGPRAAIGGVDAEQKRLQDLKDTFNALGAEIRAEQKRGRDQNLLEFLGSPLQNFAGAALVPRNRVRREDLREEIAIQEARVREALRTMTTSGNALAVASGAIGGLLGNIAQQATGATMGRIMGNRAAMTAEDAGSRVAFELYDIVTNQNRGGGAMRDQSLQAVESRFLTRGRGQLSPEAKKQAEDNAKQLAQLKKIEDAVKAMAENAVLIVEGVG